MHDDLRSNDFYFTLVVERTANSCFHEQESPILTSGKIVSITCTSCCNEIYCNYHDVTSVYSLNSRKLPGRFSYTAWERGYREGGVAADAREANPKRHCRVRLPLQRIPNSRNQTPSQTLKRTNMSWMRTNSFYKTANPLCFLQSLNCNCMRVVHVRTVLDISRGTSEGAATIREPRLIEIEREYGTSPIGKLATSFLDTTSPYPGVECVLLS